MTRRGAVAAIVVNWNAGYDLRRCIDSLIAQVRQPERILIVDNASSDDSLSGLASLHEAIEIVQLNRNIGFAAANNLAIRKTSDCEWVALLNPDAFAEPDWLAELLSAAAAHPEFSFFATRMLNHANPGVLDGAGDGYHFSGWPGRRGHRLEAAGRYLQQEEVFAPCAGAALYRRDVLMEAGGFDEDFFCYIEDVDLGFRLRLRGHRCLYVPTAIVRHVGSGTTGKGSDVSIYYGHRNLVWTFFKNMPLPLLSVLLLPHVLMNVVAVVWFVIRGRGKIILRAKTAAVMGLRRILRQRAQMEPRKVSLKAIVTILSVWHYT